MRHYETLFILNPDMNEEETQAVIDRYSGLLAERGSLMMNVDPWGRRRLAFEVKRFNKGFYVLFEYAADPDSVNEMERQFKIDEMVIRFLTVVIDKEFDAEAYQARAEERPRRRPTDDDEDLGPVKRAGEYDDDDDEEEDEDDEDEE